MLRVRPHSFLITSSLDFFIRHDNNKKNITSSGPGQNSVTKAQFVVSMLKKLKICDDDDVSAILVSHATDVMFLCTSTVVYLCWQFSTAVCLVQARFDKLDKTGDGKLSAADITEHKATDLAKDELLSQ